MSSESEPFRPQVERFREYLLLLARLHVGQGLQGKLDASDVVQQTLLDAHRQQPQFRGQTSGELAGWLRKMLACNVADAVRALGRAKRDVSREQSLDQAIQESSVRIEQWLVAEQSSPSQRLQRHERTAQLADALAKLPDAQREAITLRHCQGCSLDEICQRLERSPTAVASLLKRGVRRLRELLPEPE